MTFQDDTLHIDTPENVIFDYTIAGIGSRFMACALDTLLITGMMLFVNFALSAALRATDLLGFNEQDTEPWLVALFALLNFALFWGYYIFFETLWSGQTPGKRLNKLRVIRRDGTPITASEAVVRNLVRLIDFMPGLYAIGVIAMFIDGQSRRLGDLAAATLVVHERAGIALSSLEASTAAPAMWPDEPAGESDLPVGRLSAQDVALMEEYFLRRDQFNDREAVAARLAHTLYGRMGLATPPVAAGQAEALLSAIWQAWRQQRQP